ncbi:MAG: glycerophosphodiester phosphodiesterase family protein [Paracoccaceae bacterium]
MINLPDDFRIKPLAHRGLHDIAAGRAENSIAAIRAAIEAGYGIEIDVQLSADRHAMVIHDYDLGRLTAKKGAVRQRSAAKLGAITLRGGGETIPTLDEILDVVAGRAPILVEIKDQDGALGANTGDLERAVAGTMKDYNGPVAVMSFNPHSVGWMAKLAPRLPRGLTTGSLNAEIWQLLPAATSERLRRIPDYDKVGASFISHQIIDLDRPRVAELKAAGATILCWTARDSATERRARRIADNITFEGYRPDIPAA